MIDWRKPKQLYFLLINKIDLSNPDELNKIVENWSKVLPKAEIIPISALKDFNLEYLLKRIIEKLPESPPYFPKDSLTDKTERFFASEIIREKILTNYQKEIPYSVEVEIEEFKDTEKLLRMRAIIYVIRSSQKGIIIGHKGEALKKTGTEARKDMEDFLARKFFWRCMLKLVKTGAIKTVH
ncbi:MAG: GTPase Era [Ignavibacteriales bacterium]|nr:GTPase Era [Ignavibacteriales bacterium]